MSSSNNSNPNQKIFCKHDPNKLSCEQALCSNLSVPLVLLVLQLGYGAEATEQELTKKVWLKEKEVESCSRVKMVVGEIEGY